MSRTLIFLSAVSTITNFQHAKQNNFGRWLSGNADDTSCEVLKLFENNDFRYWIPANCSLLCGFIFINVRSIIHGKLLMLKFLFCIY